MDVLRFSPKQHSSAITEYTWYSDPDFTQGIGPKLNKLREKQLLCDTTIEVEKESFHVHRCVLIATSPYFESMFTAGWRENQTGVVKLQGAKKSGFKEVLYFAYTGLARLSEGNVVDVLSSAHHYCYPTLSKLCLHHMVNRVNKDNCLYYMKMAELYDAPSLIEKATKTAVNNFSLVSKSSLFLDLSKDTLCKLLASEDLSSASELDTFQAVRAWLVHKPERRENAHELMSHVRFNLFSPEDLKEHVLSCEIIRQDRLCMDQVLDYLVASGSVKLPHSSVSRSQKAVSGSVKRRHSSVSWSQMAVSGSVKRRHSSVSRSQKTIPGSAKRPHSSVPRSQKPISGSVELPHSSGSQSQKAISCNVNWSRSSVQIENFLRKWRLNHKK